ncbi:MAG: hypothetical protein V7K88_14985 [Nostoc sp.]|uniref:hypothetical protein n=1 Tax=Nostoc sp. TaxID=1180 RepID=UPI002FF79542
MLVISRTIKYKISTIINLNITRIRHQYIGKVGSPAFLKAVEMMKNRTKIEALNQVLQTLELGFSDLVEEAARYQK